MGSFVFTGTIITFTKLFKNDEITRILSAGYFLLNAKFYAQTYY